MSPGASEVHWTTVEIPLKRRNDFSFTGSKRDTGCVFVGNGPFRYGTEDLCRPTFAPRSKGDETSVIKEFVRSPSVRKDGLVSLSTSQTPVLPTYALV